MNLIHISTLSLAAFCAASCASPPPSRDPDGPRVKQSLILHAPSVPPGAATSLDQLLDAPSITSYTVGRTIDPADPSLLHEAHVVYRRESDASWRLQAAPAPSGSVSTAGAGRASAAPDPLRTQEIDALLSDLRRTSDENRQAIALLFQSVENLSRSKASNPNQQPTTAPSSESSRQDH